MSPTQAIRTLEELRERCAIRNWKLITPERGPCLLVFTHTRATVVSAGNDPGRALVNGAEEAMNFARKATP